MQKVEYIDKTSDAIDVLFPAVDEAAVLKAFAFTSGNQGSGFLKKLYITTVYEL